MPAPGQTCHRPGPSPSEIIPEVIYPEKRDGIICEVKTLQTSRSVQKEGQEVLQVPELRFPAACGAEHGEAAESLQSMEDHRDAEIHPQPVQETSAKTGGFPNEDCEPMGAHAVVGSWKGPEDLVERGAHARGGFLVRLWGTQT